MGIDYEAVNHQDRLGNTVLHLAALRGDIELFMVMLGFEAVDLSIKNCDKETIWDYIEKKEDRKNKDSIKELKSKFTSHEHKLMQEQPDYEGSLDKGFIFRRIKRASEEDVSLVGKVTDNGFSIPLDSKDSKGRTPLDYIKHRISKIDKKEIYYNEEEVSKDLSTKDNLNYIEYHLTKTIFNSQEPASCSRD